MSEAFAPGLEFGQKQLADIAGNGREGRFRRSAILAGHGLSSSASAFVRASSCSVFIWTSPPSFWSAASRNYAHISSCQYTSTV